VGESCRRRPSPRSLEGMRKSWKKRANVGLLAAAGVRKACRACPGSSGRWARGYSVGVGRAGISSALVERRVLDRFAGVAHLVRPRGRGSLSRSRPAERGGTRRRRRRSGPRPARAAAERAPSRGSRFGQDTRRCGGDSRRRRRCWRRRSRPRPGQRPRRGWRGGFVGSAVASGGGRGDEGGRAGSWGACLGG